MKIFFEGGETLVFELKMKIFFEGGETLVFELYYYQLKMKIFLKVEMRNC
jgi:hypothetical protein